MYQDRKVFKFNDISDRLQPVVGDAFRGLPDLPLYPVGMAYPKMNENRLPSGPLTKARFRGMLKSP